PRLQKGDNAWEYLRAVLEGRRKCEEKAHDRQVKQAGERWRAYSEARRRLLSLLGRFELSPEQVPPLATLDDRGKRSSAAADQQILANPYLISERDQGAGDSEPVALEVIDRGMRPEGDASRFLKPEDVIAQDDPRRVRGVAVAILQGGADQG